MFWVSSIVSEYTFAILQIPPRVGHPCLWLTAPTAKSVTDFHRQVVTQCLAHINGRRENHSRRPKHYIIISSIILCGCKRPVILIPNFIAAMPPMAACLPLFNGNSITWAACRYKLKCRRQHTAHDRLQSRKPRLRGTQPDRRDPPRCPSVPPEFSLL